MMSELSPRVKVYDAGKKSTYFAHICVLGETVKMSQTPLISHGKLW